MAVVEYTRSFKRKKWNKGYQATISNNMGKLELIVSKKILWGQDIKRVNLKFDEDTFDITVVNAPNGLLSIGADFFAYKITLGGFIRQFDLDEEDILGKYNCVRVGEATFIVKYLTRSPLKKSRQGSRTLRHRFTVAFNPKNYEMLKEIKGDLTWSAFLRSAVNYYVRDNYPGRWTRYVEDLDDEERD
jgi:hypothetical protein